MVPNLSSLNIGADESSFVYNAEDDSDPEFLREGAGWDNRSPEEEEEAAEAAEAAEDEEDEEAAEAAEDEEDEEAAEDEVLRLQYKIAPPRSDGWLSRNKTTISQLAPPWRKIHEMDFIFENPLDGYFWRSEAYRLLFRRAANKRDVVTINAPTSYCHYGAKYRKRTNFFTSLTNLALNAPCPKSPCARIRFFPTHEFNVSDLSSEKKNSVPSPIVEQVLNSWKRKIVDRPDEAQKIDHLLFVDAFSGFGSVAHAVRELDSRIFVVTNDKARTRGANMSFDVSRPSQFELLLQMSVYLLSERTKDKISWSSGRPWPSNVALLVWMSTPCETYSLNGLAAHRGAAGLSKLAHEHDAMNLKLAQWIDHNMLDEA